MRKQAIVIIAISTVMSAHQASASEDGCTEPAFLKAIGNMTKAGGWLCREPQQSRPVQEESALWSVRNATTAQWKVPALITRGRTSQSPRVEAHLRSGRTNYARLRRRATHEACAAHPREPGDHARCTWTEVPPTVCVCSIRNSPSG